MLPTRASFSGADIAVSVTVGGSLTAVMVTLMLASFELTPPLSVPPSSARFTVRVILPFAFNAGVKAIDPVASEGV